jgi:hypothetical protein
MKTANLSEYDDNNLIRIREMYSTLGAKTRANHGNSPPEWDFLIKSTNEVLELRAKLREMAERLGKKEPGVAQAA